MVKKNKAYFPAFIIQGDIFSNWDKNEEAEEAFTKAISLEVHSALPNVFRGKFYAKTDRVDLAILNFTEAISRDSSYTLSFFERGFINTLNRNYDEAIQDFDIVNQLNPEWAKSTIVFEAFHNRGIERIQKKTYHKAVEDFNRAIEINPDYLNAYLNRGPACKNLKNILQLLKILATF